MNYNIYKLSVIAFIAIFLSASVAYSAAIKGTVKLSDTERTLAGVSIYLEDTNLGTISNGFGNFEINNIPADKFTIKASHIGYSTFEQEITITRNKTQELEIRLNESISDLDEVIVMSNGYTGIRDILGSVQYISPKELQKFNYTDINRALRTAPGINIQEEDGYGLRPNIGLRGTGSERSSKITVMEDGILMAPAPYAAPAAYYFPTIGRINAIEILKGSSQIKYGPYTTGGAINLISTPIPDDFSGKVSISGGSYGAHNLHAVVGNSHEQVAYMAETFQYNADGFKDLDNGEHTGFDKKDYIAKVRVNSKPSSKVYQSLTFKIGQTSEISNETYLGLTDEDYENTPYRRYAASQKDKMTTEHQQYSATHLVRFSEKIRLRTTAYRNEFARNWYKLDKIKDDDGDKIKIAELLSNPAQFTSAYKIVTGSTSQNDDALYVKANNREYFAQGIQTELGMDYSTEKLKHNFTFGLRYHMDEIDRFQWVDKYNMNESTMMLTNKGLPGTESNRVESAEALAGYFQYQLKYGQWTISPGIRYENINMERTDYGKDDTDRTGSDASERRNSIDVWLPGLAVNYSFKPELNIFAGIHKGFAPPGTKEETLPEESINYEIGLRYSEAALSFEAVGFFNDYNNLLGSDLNASGGNGTGLLINGGEVITKGLEIQTRYDIFAKSLTKFRIPLILSYTYTDAFFENDFESDYDPWGKVSSGDELPYLPKHQLALIIGLEHHRFSFNLSTRFIDKMRAVAGAGEIPSSELIDSYLVMDASASWKVHRYIELFTGLYNMTDEIYAVARRPAGLRPGMPLTLKLGINTNF